MDRKSFESQYDAGTALSIEIHRHPDGQFLSVDIVWEFCKINNIDNKTVFELDIFFIEIIL